MALGVSSSLYDLSGNLIENTFQRILQVAGSDNDLYDGTGSIVTDLRISGSFEAVSFVGDGSGLSGVTAEWDGTHNGNAQITGSLIVTAGISGSFSGSFEGDGSSLTGITAEWDGTHSGNASITGGLDVTGGVTASLQGTSSWAETVEYANITNVPVIKNGIISGSDFGGTTLTSSVSFTTPFTNNIYSVTVTGHENRSYTVKKGKTASGFTIDTNSSVAIDDEVYWQAIKVGEFG